MTNLQAIIKILMDRFREDSGDVAELSMKHL